MVSHFPKRRGFTLIELLVVIAIIAVFIGLLMPAVQKVREAAARMSCQNNLKQIGLALYNFENVYQRFPVGGYRLYQPPQNGFSWLLSITPYIEQNSLGSRILNVGYTYSYAQQLAALSTPVKLYYCPSEPRAYPIFVFPGSIWSLPCADYLAISGVDVWDGSGIINDQTLVRVTDITDGTSNTIMVGERPPLTAGNFLPWWAGNAGTFSGVANSSWWLVGNDQNGNSCGAPPFLFGGGPLNVNNWCSYDYVWSNHLGGANFVLGDGSIRFLSYSTNPTIMAALATRAGGEVVQVP